MKPKHYRRWASITRVLAHPVRLQILDALVREPLCVCDLVRITAQRQPYVSQQLAVLRSANLVRGERDGCQVRYRLICPELVELLKSLMVLNARGESQNGQNEGEEGYGERET